MTNLSITSIITALIVLAQSLHPRTPKLLAPLVAVLFGAIFGLLNAGTLTLAAALHGIYLGVAGLGFVTLGEHLGSKIAEGYWKTRDAQSPAPPPESSTNAPGANDDKGASSGERKA